jgi:hypothetical protein
MEAVHVDLLVVVAVVVGRARYPMLRCSMASLDWE